MVGRAATPNEPTSPNLRIAILLALLIGAGAGLAAAYVADAFDQSLKSLRDFERYFGDKPLATIPFIPAAALHRLRPQDRHPAGYIVERPMSAAAEGFRTLRAALLYAEPDVSAQVVAITSAVSGEGKTSSAFSMARIAALSGQRVVVIDCDLRKQALTALSDIRPSAGILELLRGTAQLDEVVHVDPSSGAHMIPALSESFTVQDVFGSPAMVSLVKQLRAQYDLIIFDCPPFLAVAESRVLTRLADQTIVLARWGWCSPDVIQNVLEQLRDSGAYIRGIALTCVNADGAGRSAARPGFGRSKFTAGYYAD